MVFDTSLFAYASFITFHVVSFLLIGLYIFQKKIKEEEPEVEYIESDEDDRIQGVTLHKRHEE